MTVGELIKAARIKAGMTQAQLAAKLGIPYQSIGQWERNVRHPKKETIERIATALNIDYHELTPTLSERRVAQSFSLEQYLSKSGLELIDDYDHKGIACTLIIDHNKRRLCLIPTNKMQAFEATVHDFLEHKTQKLLDEGIEIEDTEGWFD